MKLQSNFGICVNKQKVIPLLYPLGTRWGTYLRCCSQEGRSSELRLRRGVGQAAHSLNNPQVEYIGVLLCKSTE